MAIYREKLSEIVATSSSRGLANWVHDRMWYHVVSSLEHLDHIFIVDKGPVREIVVEGTYRIRLKRHDKRGRVRTYPTKTALAFLSQPPEQLVLFGFDKVHLIAGYQWESTTHEIGPAVLSLRDGLDNLVWMIELPAPDAGTSVSSINGPYRPESPEIGFPEDDTGEAEASQQ